MPGPITPGGETVRARRWRFLSSVPERHGAHHLSLVPPPPSSPLRVLSYAPHPRRGGSWLPRAGRGRARFPHRRGSFSYADDGSLCGTKAPQPRGCTTSVEEKGEKGARAQVGSGGSSGRGCHRCDGRSSSSSDLPVCPPPPRALSPPRGRTSLQLASEGSLRCCCL